MAIQGNSKLIAIVDDDAAVRVALEGLLRSAGLSARAFDSAETFIESGQQFQTGCLIADIRMPGMSGLELQGKLNSEQCRIPIVFITPHGDTPIRVQSLRHGQAEFLAEPFNDEVLLETVRAALEN